MAAGWDADLLGRRQPTRRTSRGPAVLQEEIEAFPGAVSEEEQAAYGAHDGELVLLPRDTVYLGVVASSA